MKKRVIKAWLRTNLIDIFVEPIVGTVVGVLLIDDIPTVFILVASVIAFVLWVASAVLSDVLIYRINPDFIVDRMIRHCGYNPFEGGEDNDC
jgi:hypothetical protein